VTYRLGGGVLRDTFRSGKAETGFTGLRFRLGCAKGPCRLVVRYGSQEGGADLGEARINLKAGQAAGGWYDAVVAARKLAPRRRYFVELRGEGEGTSLFGVRPLGGDALA
ncbi:MAG: hypothetical protein ACK56I_11010, partial [bacterium]